MNRDIERDERIRLYQNRMLLKGLYDPDEIKVDDKTLAYIAGLFDGEVQLNIGHTEARSYGLYMCYLKTNYEILKYLSDIFGGNVRQAKPQANWRFKVWRWYLGGGYAYRVLRKLYPFLRIKQEAAGLCIEFFENYWQERSVKPVSPERQAVGAHYISQLQKYQSKPGSSKTSRPAHRKVKEGSLSTAPEHVQPHDTFKSYNHNDIVLSELEVAYIAGLLDVEGSFIIYKLSKRPSYLLEVNYRKTDHNTLQYLANIYGGRVRPAPLSSKNIKDVWLWKVVSVNAYVLLRDIYRFLRIKRRAAEICMEFFENYWQEHSYGIAVSPERQAIGANYAALLRQYQTKSMPHKRKDVEAQSGI